MPGARVLVPADQAEVPKPELNERPDGTEWHPAAVEMWDAIWSSPMAAEFDAADVHRMVIYLDLVHTYWSLNPTEKGVGRRKVELAAEIRLQGQLFGLTPLDRRRLSWEIERAEQAKDAGNRRRASRTEPGQDPRERF